jgi:hypothetical protein
VVCAQLQERLVSDTGLSTEVGWSRGAKRHPLFPCGVAKSGHHAREHRSHASKIHPQILLKNHILKRLLIHAAGFNLSLVLRKILGLGTARGLQGLTAAALRRLAARRADLWTALRTLWIDAWCFRAPTYAAPRQSDFPVRLAA